MPAGSEIVGSDGTVAVDGVAGYVYPNMAPCPAIVLSRVVGSCLGYIVGVVLPAVLVSVVVDVGYDGVVHLSDSM